ncbi:hypothetical protein M422DRAFT_82422, partial [Sphaerobolus stellatus SS14]
LNRSMISHSDCLKATQREGMLLTEILSRNPDILCLQEVDRLEKLIPQLEASSYKTLYACGPGKRHGCMIAYRDALFDLAEHTSIEYDVLTLRESGTEVQRIASSRRTKNIGLIAALSSKSNSHEGYVVATTHLFWHPSCVDIFLSSLSFYSNPGFSFTYERTRNSYLDRQAGLLLREIYAFREKHSLHEWPCIIAGDFNFPPSDPAYAFLVGETLSPTQSKIMADSRVIHISIDPSILPDNPVPPKDDEEGATATAADPDRVITNSRRAYAEDGLLSNDELEVLFQNVGPLRSLYDEG